MPFSQIISRSFDIAWRNRSLWILGMIFAFFGGGGAGGGSTGGSTSYRMDGFDPTRTPDSPFPAPDFPAWLTFENIVLFTVAAVLIAIVIGLIWLVLQSIAHAGLIYGSDKAIDETPAGWRELWRAGRRGPWKSLFWLKFFVRFLPGILFALIGLAIALSIALPLIGMANPDVAAEQMFGAVAPLLCLVPCLVILILVVFWVLSLIENYAARVIVLEGQNARSAWSQGWQLLRARMVDSFLMSILLWLLLAIAGFIVAIPLFILAALAVIPAFLLFENLATIPPAILIGGGIVAALLIALIGAILSGPLLAFRETAWTMTYRYLRGREIPSAPVSG